MSTATFDPSNATVVVNTAQGVTTWRPPFATQAQITSYADGLQNVSALRKKGMLTLVGPLTPTTDIASISTDLPAVQIYNIPINDPPIFAVVYTDINGNSSFSYKNDPNNVIQLVTNGSQIPPTVQQSTPSGTQGNSGTQGKSGTELVCNYCGGRVDPGCPPQSMACAANQTQNYDAGTKSNEGGGILGLICWCLSCMSCIGIVILCVLLVIKQSSVPQPSTQ